jgi:hypothetical protein
MKWCANQNNCVFVHWRMRCQTSRAYCGIKHSERNSHFIRIIFINVRVHTSTPATTALFISSSLVNNKRHFKFEYGLSLAISETLEITSGELSAAFRLPKTKFLRDLAGNRRACLELVNQQSYLLHISRAALPAISLLSCWLQLCEVRLSQLATDISNCWLVNQYAEFLRFFVKKILCKLALVNIDLMKLLQHLYRAKRNIIDVLRIEQDYKR